MRLIEYTKDSGVAVLRTQSNWVLIAPNDVVSFKTKAYAIKWLYRAMREMAEMSKTAKGDDIAIIRGNANAIAWQIETIEDLE